MSATAIGELFRSLLRTDLVGELLGSAAFLPASGENACRFACLALPGCDAYAYSAGVLELRAVTTGELNETAPCYLHARATPCYLYNNVTALTQSSLMTAGVMVERYS